jgi:hypothetical protein
MMPITTDTCQPSVSTFLIIGGRSQELRPDSLLGVWVISGV